MFLSDQNFAFTLEAYANDTPTPNILPTEVDNELKISLLTCSRFDGDRPRLAKLHHYESEETWFVETVTESVAIPPTDS